MVSPQPSFNSLLWLSFVFQGTISSSLPLSETGRLQPARLILGTSSGERFKVRGRAQAFQSPFEIGSLSLTPRIH